MTALHTQYRNPRHRQYNAKDFRMRQTFFELQASCHCNENNGEHGPDHIHDSHFLQPQRLHQCNRHQSVKENAKKKESHFLALVIFPQETNSDGFADENDGDVEVEHIIS